MNAITKLCIVGVFLAISAPAGADDEPIDLTIDQIPVEVTSLAIRGAASAASAPAIPMSVPPPVAVGAAVEGDVSGSFTPVPTSLRDVQERVQFKFNVGYDVIGAGVSGDVNKTGVVPDQITDPNGNAFTESRQGLIGDAVVGTRGILLPTLNAYFLSRYNLDFDGASQFASLNTVYDSDDGRDVLVQAAYAEIDGLPSIGLPGVHVRAGRQFRYGSTMMVTRFDGITAGYDDPAFQASAFFGRRASVFFGGFFDEDPGLVGGAGVKLRLEELANVPLDLSADYLFFDAGGVDLDLDGTDDLEQARSFVELVARTQFGKSRVSAHARLADKGERVEFGQLEEGGLALASVGAQLRQPISDKLLLVAELDQRFEDALSYDYINPSPIDVINVSQQIGIGLDPPEQATRIGVRMNAMVNRQIELYGFGRLNVVSDDSLSGFNRPWQEFGGAVSAKAAPRVTVSGQYKLRLTQFADAANEVESLFDDTGGSGVTSFHEILAEARYSLGYRKMNVGVGAYFRVYNLQTPYAEITQDDRAGGRATLDYTFSKMTTLRVEGEAAQPSPTYSPDLTTLYAFRAMMEVMF